MKRRSLTILCVLSLTLCVVAALAWVRSYRAYGCYPLVLQGSGWQVSSWWGRLFVCRIHAGDNVLDSPGFRPASRVILRIPHPRIGEHAPKGPQPSVVLGSGELGAGLTMMMPRINLGEATCRNGFGFDRYCMMWGSGNPLTDFSVTGLVVPYWPLCLLGSVPSFFALAKWQRQRRRLHLGRCLSCGYDLRASKDRCPECGRPIPRSGPSLVG